MPSDSSPFNEADARRYNAGLGPNDPDPSIPIDANGIGIIPPCRTIGEFRDYVLSNNLTEHEVLMNVAFQTNKIFHLINKLMNESPLGAMMAAGPGGTPFPFPFPK